MSPGTGQAPLDARIAELARAQHGAVSLEQLVLLGLTASCVRKRAAAGRLHRLHRGVYAVGHPAVTPHGRWMAAVLACGPGAALSHRSAADLLGLRPSSSSLIHVTAPSRAGRTRAGIRAHSDGTLRPQDVITEDGIPCTSVARTLIDIAETLTLRELERACERAEILRIFDLAAIVDVLDHAPGRRGAKRLRQAIAAARPLPAYTRNHLESTFFHLCELAGLPLPQVNLWVDGYEVDFHWPELMLIVETDGDEAHSSPWARRNDTRRDRRLRLKGWNVLRFTAREVFEEPDMVVAELRTARLQLSAAGGR